MKTRLTCPVKTGTIGGINTKHSSTCQESIRKNLVNTVIPIYRFNLIQTINGIVHCSYVVLKEFKKELIYIVIINLLPMPIRHLSYSPRQDFVLLYQMFNNQHTTFCRYLSFSPRQHCVPFYQNFNNQRSTCYQQVSFLPRQNFVLFYHIVNTQESSVAQSK